MADQSSIHYEKDSCNTKEVYKVFMNCDHPFHLISSASHEVLHIDSFRLDVYLDSLTYGNSKLFGPNLYLLYDSKWFFACGWVYFIFMNKKEHLFWSNLLKGSWWKLVDKNACVSWRRNVNCRLMNSTLDREIMQRKLKDLLLSWDEQWGLVQTRSKDVILWGKSEEGLGKIPGERNSFGEWDLDDSWRGGEDLDSWFVEDDRGRVYFVKLKRFDGVHRWSEIWSEECIFLW